MEHATNVIRMLLVVAYIILGGRIIKILLDDRDKPDTHPDVGKIKLILGPISPSLFRVLVITNYIFSGLFDDIPLKSCRYFVVLG